MLNNILNLFQSPRFVAWYWSMGTIASVAFLNLISESLLEIGLPAWAVVALGGIIAQITKAMSNSKQGKPLGFSNK